MVPVVLVAVVGHQLLVGVVVLVAVAARGTPGLLVAMAVPTVVAVALLLEQAVLAGSAAMEQSE